MSNSPDTPPEQTQTGPDFGYPVREPGRVRSAWHVLRGQRMVPLQIQFEWLEYQQLFDDLLKRFGAQLARSAKAEKKRVAKLFTPEEPEMRAAPIDKKAELRARARGLRNGGHHRLSAQMQPTNPTSEEP